MSGTENVQSIFSRMGGGVGELPPDDWAEGFLRAPVHENLGMALQALAWGLYQNYRRRGVIASLARRIHGRSSHPWEWVSLDQRAQFRVGLMQLNRKRPVPLHGHVGQYGVQLVLTGRVRVRQYEPLFNLRARENPMTLLKAVKDSRYGSMQSAHYLPGQGDIHDLSALSQRALLFCVSLVPAGITRQRQWYVPLAPFQRSAPWMIVRPVNVRPNLDTCN